MHTATIDENSLRLTGNKIKLTTRPIENYSTASSRCALLGRSYSRPVSAVPLLNLNYNEFAVHTNIRRPLSADFPVSRLKDSSYRSNLSFSHNRYESPYADGETSIESSEETEGTLPSSQLLHNLLSEPLCSWRNGIRCKGSRKNKMFKKPALKFSTRTFDNSDSNETPSAGSDTSSSAESVGQKPHKSQIQNNDPIRNKPITSKLPTGVKPHNLEMPTNEITTSKIINNQQPVGIASEDSKTANYDKSKAIPNDQQLKDVQPHKMNEFLTIQSNSLISSQHPEKSQQSETINNDVPTKSTVQQSIGESYTPVMVENKTDGTDKTTKAQDTNCNAMPLLPGLKTKPPLPKKLDVSHTNSAKSVRKTNSPYPSQNDGADLEKSNFEQITLGMLNYNVMMPKHNPKEDELGRPVDDLRNHAENSEPQNIEQNQETGDQTSTSTLTSDNDTIDLKFQNWFREEQRASDEIMESEFHTDLSLHRLKSQHKKIDESANEESQNSSNYQQKDEVNNLKNGLKKAKQGLITKAVNFQPFDVQDLKSDYEKHKKNATIKNFIKYNIKMTSNQNMRKSSNLSTTEMPKKTKFVPTQMKSFRDYTETNEQHDIESWMSSNLERSSTKTPTEEIAMNQNSCSKPPSYLDFLNEINELQETCEDCCLDNIPQHDKDDATTDQSDANTYDDIVSILQVLEEQDKKSQMKMECIKEIVNNELCSTETEDTEKMYRTSCSRTTNKIDIISNMDFNEDCICNETTAEKYYNDSNCSTHSKSREQEQPSRSSLNSSTNLNDIFSYLDAVDRNCAQSLACAKERVQSTTQVMENNIKLDTIPKLEELLAYTNVELSHHVIDLSLRLKEKSSSISLLQKELSTLRNQVTKMTNDTNAIVKQRLKSQKEDYENVVKRHQKFIDQLIADKKTLNQQCEGLLHEMKVLEDRYNSNLKAAEHKHKVELQKVKEMHVAGEKIRRERWIDTKTQKIKELTVKGLEPELDKMASRHQQELTDLRSLHKREIEDLELRAARKMQQQCEALREQLTTEREKALSHEREVLRQRYEQLVESEEHNYQEQRRRLLADHANRISECEERENAAVIERDRALKQVKNEFEDKYEAALRRHNTELNVLKEKTELEMEAFRNNYKKQAAVQLAEKETQIREKCRKERDKEIEAVIERLEKESNETKVQIEQSTENRIRRLREKYESEIKDLEYSEKDATSKYSEAKTKLLATEDLVISFKASLQQLEIQLQETKKFSEKLSKERTKIKEIVKEEMRQEIQILEKELQELRNGKDKELQQVYARVKVAVARKDETISELTRDHTALQEKCVYLENMLEQQRKEYLIK